MANARTVAGIAMTALIALAPPTAASRYDLARPIWLEGRIVGASIGRALVELTIRTPDDLTLPRDLPDLGPAATFLDARSLSVRSGTRGRAVTVTLPPTRTFHGIDGSVAPGERVTIVALRDCAPPHRLKVQWLRLGGGQVVAHGAATPFMIRSC